MDINERLKKDEKYHQKFYKKHFQNKLLSENDRVFIDGKEVSNVVLINNNINSQNTIEYKTFVHSDNIFTNMLQKVYYQETCKKQKDFAETYLREKQRKMENKLAEGKLFYDDKHYDVALECYERVMNDFNTDSYPDEFGLTTSGVLSIHYAIILCNVNIKSFGSLQSALSKLCNLINDQGWGNSYPCFYWRLAQIYCILKDFKKCSETLEVGMKKIKHAKYVDPLFWPGSKDLIMDDITTLKTRIIKVLENCKTPEKPNEVCYYNLCIINGHSQKGIYFE